jgi:hypothetical protein
VSEKLGPTWFLVYTFRGLGIEWQAPGWGKEHVSEQVGHVPCSLHHATLDGLVTWQPWTLWYVGTAYQVWWWDARVWSLSDRVWWCTKHFLGPFGGVLNGNFKVTSPGACG